MNPVSIRGRFFRSYESFDVTFPDGCVAVIGDNGSGKSSLLEAIRISLFGARSLAPYLTTGEEELELELQVEHAGELYRIRRQFSARGRGKTTLDFEKCWSSESTYGRGFNETTAHAGGWEPLSRETARATQDLIEATFGLSEKTFASSSFLGQGKGGAFTEADPSERKQILSEILGLDLWPKLLDRTRVDLRRYEDDLVKAETVAGMCEEVVARKPALVEERDLWRSRLDATRSTLAAAERELEEAQHALAAARTVAERVRACEAEARAAEEAHERVRALFAAANRAAQDLADKQIELEELQADAKHVADLEAKLVALRGFAEMRLNALGARATLTTEAEQRSLAASRMTAQGLALVETANELRAKAEHLQAHIGESASCDRCGQTLGAEAAARAAESYRGEAADADAKGRAVIESATAEAVEIDALYTRAAAIEVPDAQDPTPTERILAAARRAAEQAAALAENVRQLTEIAGQREQLGRDLTEAHQLRTVKQERLAEARETLVDLDAANARAERWKIAVQEARELIENRQADVVRAETELARVADAEQQLAGCRTAITANRARLDLLKLAEKAYGRDGIPALIVENAAIPQLELEANRILGELGGSTAGCRIELRTQRALKSAADVLRETLDIVIVAPTGERPYETFSGGERTRLNLALRIALARLLAHRRGAESRLLAIDEPDGLDADGMDRLSQVLYGMSGTFDRILVVSHNTLLSTAFDQTLSVVKENGRSRILDGVPQAVAA